MRHIHKTIALAGLLVLLTFSAALGQSDRQTIIYIPFNFTVGEKSFPAGKYVIQQNRTDSDAVWAIRHKDNVGKALFLTNPVRSTNPVEEIRLVFKKYDDVYFLSEFWTPGNNTGRQIQISNRERGLALAVKPEEHVLTARGR
jgi:hypothetical protein